MRTLAAAFVSLLVLLAGCADMGMTRAGADCERSTVPSGAVYGARQGMDIATWPPEMARGVTGCQRVWYGERTRPDAMQVLATYYYEKGQVRRLTGRVPNGDGYDCQYADGVLDATKSQNPAQCPKAASEIEPGR